MSMFARPYRESEPPEAPSLELHGGSHILHMYVFLLGRVQYSLTTWASVAGVQSVFGACKRKEVNLFVRGSSGSASCNLHAASATCKCATRQTKLHMCILTIFNGSDATDPIQITSQNTLQAPLVWHVLRAS